MITKDELVEIGKFQKTHALKGELNALLDIDDEYVVEGNPIVIDIDGIYVPFYAETVRPKGSTSYLIKLKDIDSADAAKIFVNKSIYGVRKDLLNYYDDPDAEIVEDFVGYTVKDKDHGVIGEIIDINDDTANILFVVRTEEDKEIYVPVAEEFIIAVDDDKKTVEMNLPQGLLDMN